MSVKVAIYYPQLRDMISNPDTLELDGGNIGECLGDLLHRFPEASPVLLDDRDNLHRHVFIFVNAETVHKPAMTTPVADGDRLIIAALVVGG